MIIFTAIHLFNLCAASSGKYHCDICAAVNVFPPRVTPFLVFDVTGSDCAVPTSDLQAYKVRMCGCALPDETLIAGYPVMAIL